MMVCLLNGVIHSKERCPEVWQVSYCTPCGLVVTQLWRQCTVCYAVKAGTENSVIATCSECTSTRCRLHSPHQQGMDWPCDDGFHVFI